MATYSTDLTTLTTAESGTWTEFASPYNGAGTPAIDTENYIQGTNCYSQTTGKAVGLEISIVFDNGANVTFATGEAVFAWCFYAVGTNIETYANGGWRFGIGSSTSAWDYFYVSGSDYGRNPYGGWFNVAIDPTATETGTIGGGNGGSYRYFGSVPNTLNEVSKGTPSGMDAIRYGRGTLSITGSGGTFSELASYNDWNSTATPPGTSSTVLDSGYHRFGLFQAQSGTYLWKGLISFGLTGTSVTFSDSNETIIIDDCPHTYAAFNKIEVHNASSSVSLTNITFISTATTTNGVGYFEVVDNATVSLSGCSFNSMGNFSFLTNSTINSTFNNCGLVTAGGANLSGSTFNNSTTSSSLLWNTDSNTDGKLDGCSFTSDGSNHAIEITALSGVTSITLRNCEFNNYAGSNGSTGNEAIYVNIASGSFTINAVNCSGNVYYRTAGATVTVVSDPRTITITATDTDGNPVQNARVFLRANAAGSLPYNAAVTISNSGTTATVTHTSHGLSTGDRIVIYGASINENLGIHKITVTGTNTYTYTTANSVTNTDSGNVYFVYIGADQALSETNDLTDVNGQVSYSRVFSTSQAALGTARKSSSAPYYKPAPITGTVSSTGDTSLSAVLISD